MARLILTYNKQVVSEHPFAKGGMTIGRHEDNSVIIDNPAVSGFHARIDRKGSDYFLTDLQSTNGTFVNDEKISSRKLSHGDNILIGEHVILFLAPSGEAAGVVKKTALNKTIRLDTKKQKDLLSKQKTPPIPVKLPEKIGVVSFIDGSGLGEMELVKKITRIGKADTSEIRLPGVLMGATAATITRRPSGYVITFTGGMAKLKVNGKIVKDSVKLHDFDTIELGSYKFQFYQKEMSPQRG
jgi:pSer/pThr/pTyr-binding forkhead associated (FHA) protein